MENKNINSSFIDSENDFFDEINLQDKINFFKRHKNLFGILTGITLIFSGGYFLITKPTWEGQFEIVLAEEKTNKPSNAAQMLLAQNPAIANLIGAQPGSNNLKTEVKILQSRSILKPIFDYVKATKKQKGENVKDLRFKDWYKDKIEINYY